MKSLLSLWNRWQAICAAYRRWKVFWKPSAGKRKTRHRPYFRRSHVRFPYLLPRCPGPLPYSSGHDLSWKIIGGGLPAAAYGGRREIMNCIAPDGSVYQAGTLSGNPLAVTAGIETLKQMMAIPDFDKILEKKTKDLLTGWKQAADKAGVPLVCHQSGSMFGIFFSEKTCSIITTPAAPMRRSSKPGSSPCLTSTSIWHLLPLKPFSCPMPTVTKTLKRLSRQQKKPWKSSRNQIKQ